MHRFRKGQICKMAQGVYMAKARPALRLFSRAFLVGVQTQRLNTALNGIQVIGKFRPAALGDRHRQDIDDHQVGDA